MKLIVSVMLAGLLSIGVAEASDIKPRRPPPPRPEQWRILGTTNLGRIGIPAGEDNPVCKGQYPNLPAIIVQTLAGGLDSNIGVPISDIVTSDPDFWPLMHKLLGVNGQSSCAALCGIAPAAALVKICAEDPAFGRRCNKAIPPNAVLGTYNPGPLPYSRFEKLTRITKGNGSLYCMVVKNWSDTLGRRFTLESNF